MLRLVVVFATAMVMCAISSGDDFTEIHGDGVYSTSQKNEANRRLKTIERDFEKHGLKGMAERTNAALGAVIKIGVMNLKRHGYSKEATEIQNGWKLHNGELQRLVANPGRDIGDFEPLNKYLAIAYFILEQKLGYDLCRTLRLSDIMTLNFCIPVVFAPCKYGESEFTKHFVHDDKYRGLAPVVAYWVTSLTCSVATFGAGYFFVCSPIGMLVELGTDRVVAPALAPKIYGWSCN